MIKSLTRDASGIRDFKSRQGPGRVYAAFVGCLCFAAATIPQRVAAELFEQARAIPWRAVIVRCDQVTPNQLETWREQGVMATLVVVSQQTPEHLAAVGKAVARMQAAGLETGYWIEVARCPELADAHPLWMASLQGHPEWRRLFPQAPHPGPRQVVKNYPWVPILNQEAYDAQLTRVTGCLQKLPAVDHLFLNDLQGAPSACGCGNTLCRWTTDYGKIRTATPAAPGAAARFVCAVQSQFPNTRVVPVWTTECEQADGAHDAACAGVGCFDGICWRAYTQQLQPVAEESPLLGVFLPLDTFQRNLPRYGQPAGWIRHAIGTFQRQPPKHQGDAILGNRLIAVLQAGPKTSVLAATQIAVAAEAGVNGCAVALTHLNQDWHPRVFTVPDPP